MQYKNWNSQHRNGMLVSGILENWLIVKLLPREKESLFRIELK